MNSGAGLAFLYAWKVRCESEHLDVAKVDGMMPRLGVVNRLPFTACDKYEHFKDQT